MYMVPMVICVTSMQQKVTLFGLLAVNILSFLESRLGQLHQVDQADPREEMKTIFQGNYLLVRNSTKVDSRL